jgi:Pyridoxamine 5'-phosphate oxidase
MKLDTRGSTVLGEEACRRLLERAAASSGVGRIAINGAPSPYVIPVNFTVVEGGIVIRLGTGWAAFHMDGVAVTFEADQASVTRHSGWSVVVEGVARLVPYEEVARLGANLPTPIVTVPGVRVFEIVPFKVTGRAVEPDLRGEQSDPVTESPEKGVETPRSLHLGRDAAEELVAVLVSVIADLSSAIADTDNAAFRRGLVQRRRLLDGVADQLAIPDVRSDEEHHRGHG